MKSTTDFGFEQIPVADKVGRVAAVFDSVASRYDLMNDAMSLGLHRWWKRIAVSRAGLRPGQRVLDVAAGSGDMTLAMQKKVGETGVVVHSDINLSMLKVGRDRLLDSGVLPRSLVCDAEALPFADAYFDRVMVAFGLRNMTDKTRALGDMLRVIKPGGKLVVLEFSRPLALIAPPYDWYSFTLIPKLGGLLAGDSESYRYLAESIRMHPDQETLASMLRHVGFGQVDYLNLTGGVVAIHQGYRVY